MAVPARPIEDAEERNRDAMVREWGRRVSIRDNGGMMGGWSMTLELVVRGCVMFLDVVSVIGNSYKRFWDVVRFVRFVWGWVDWLMGFLWT